MAPDLFAPLCAIRDIEQYTSRNASKGSMLPELYRLSDRLAQSNQVYSRNNVRHLIVNDNVLNKSTFDNRTTIWSRLAHRYFTASGEWVVKSLIQAVLYGAGSKEFISLAYLYYALRDRVAFDFVTTTIWERWQAGGTHLSANDFLTFLQGAQETHPEINAWRETTRSRLARNTLAALRDFGLLHGTSIKQIQRPSISNEVVYHLFAILWAEGKRGRAVLEAADWRLFLWREADINDAFLRMAQLGWVKFERSGSTVILDLVRLPEAVNDEQA